MEIESKEPTADHWIALCTVQNYEDYLNSHYVETLQVYDRPIHSRDERVFNESLHFEDTGVLRDSITVMKTNGTYKVRRFRKQTNATGEEEEDVMEPSEFQILNTFYKHPEMHDSIQLNVPSEMMIVGNELFSSAFVRRCLEYQHPFFVFDANYTLEIVDSNINIHTLTSTNYLCLEKTGASVK